MKMKRVLQIGTVLLAGLVAAAPALAVNFPEVEPNDAKATATPANCLNPGDTVSGTSTASTGAGIDTFLLTTCGQPLGIYRHEMTITSSIVGHTGTIRGLTQSAGGVINAGTNTAVQTSSSTTTPPRFNAWYGFGKSEQLYYQVTGAAATTAPYTSTLTSTPVSATYLGIFQPGNITIQTLGQTTTDTDFWVYDSNLNAIPGYGNDDESIAGGGGGTTLQGLLTRSYSNGSLYYLALTNFNLANNLASPPDEDFQLGSVLDFPNAVANSSTTTGLNLNFRVTDSAGSTNFVSTKTAPFQIQWFAFSVPEPSTIALLGLGLLATLKRRRSA